MEVEPGGVGEGGGGAVKGQLDPGVEGGDVPDLLCRGGLPAASLGVLGSPREFLEHQEQK